MNNRPDKSPRARRIERLFLALDQCEQALAHLGEGSPEARALKQRLSRARKNLQRLETAAPSRIVDGISEELAHWIGNLDPLPDTYLPTDRPFGGPSRRR